MLTSLDPQNAQFLAAIDNLQQNISQASNQVASGLSISQPSDAPDEISTLLQLRANQQQNQQIQSNLTLAQTDAQAADNALNSSIQMMNSAATLATEGASGTSTAANNIILAQQVGSILQQMVTNSQTVVDGRYIFSGDQDDTPQYTYDATQANPVVTVQTTASTRLIQAPAGETFAASLTAQQIFDDRDASSGDPAEDNVFNALTTLQTALQNNNSAGITNSLTLLQAASDHLDSMQAFYGNVEDQIQNASNSANQYNVDLQTEIGNLQDANITQAATNLAQGNTQLQAAMEMEGQMPHTTLFNYLA